VMPERRRMRQFVERMLEYQQAWQMPVPQHFNCQP
jgi:hypothetical protein